MVQLKAVTELSAWLESWLAVESVRFDGAVSFVAAGPGEVGEVLRVLDESAAWLKGRGIEQWPSRFESSWVAGAIGRGETWLVEVDGQIAATVTMDWADAAWSGVPGKAAYLHRMAVRRRSAGLGAVILAWAAETAGQHGCDALRLDCVASNSGLRAYYEAAGFVFRGNVVVAGAPGQRVNDGPVTEVSRYELPIAGGKPG